MKDQKEQPAVVHMGRYITPRGVVAPLCALRPIDLKVEELTLMAGAVTCQKCRALFEGADRKTE